MINLSRLFQRNRDSPSDVAETSERTGGERQDSGSPAQEPTGGTPATSTRTRRGFHREVVTGVAVSLSNGALPSGMSAMNLVTDQIVPLTEGTAPSYTSGLLAPDFYENLLAYYAGGRGDRKTALPPYSDAMLYFKKICAALNYFGLTAHPQVPHPVPWTEWVEKYLPTCPTLDAQKILKEPALLKQFCRAYSHTEHTTLRSQFTKEPHVIEALTAWRAFREDGLAFQLVDQHRHVDTFVSQTMSQDQLDRLKLRVLQLILPEPTIANVDLEDSKPRYLSVSLSESSSYLGLSLDYDHSFFEGALRVLDKRIRPDQMALQLINLVHDFRIEKLYQFFQANPDHLEAFCRGYEKLKQEILNVSHQPSDESSEDQIGHKTPQAPNHLTWGGSQFHPELRRYRRSLFPT